MAQVLRCRHPHIMSAADTLTAAPLPHKLLYGGRQRCEGGAEHVRDLVAGPELVQGGADATNVVVAPHGLQSQAALWGQVPIRAPVGHMQIDHEPGQAARPGTFSHGHKAVVSIHLWVHLAVLN